MDNPGEDTVVILKRPARRTRRLPTDPPAADDTPITKAGCLFESQKSTEVVDLATKTSEIAWVFLPVDPDTLGITSADAIQFDDRVFEMQGPRAVETGVDGEQVQVWCVVKWEAG